MSVTSLTNIASINNPSNAIRTKRSARTVMLATASVAAIGLAAPARAQDSSLETVVVTGSHITTPGFQAPTPITSISADYLQQTGTLNGTQLIYELPQLIPNVAAQNASSNAGQSTFNLRNLGATRTLLLIDGHRVQPTSFDGTTDANILPLSLVKRVDTVTAGASAAYGSDAIAGVLNFILDTNYEGFKVSGQAGESQYHDNKELQLSATYGTAFAGGKGHLVISGEVYSNNGEDFGQGRRQWGRQGYNRVANPNFVLGAQTVNNYATIIISDARFTNSSFGGLITSAGPLHFLNFLGNGVVAPITTGTYVGATFMQGGSGDTLYDKGSLAPHQGRDTLFTRLSYDITDDITAYGELSILHHTASTPIIPSPSQANITITNQNPFLPATVTNIMTANAITQFVMGRSNLELGYNTNTAQYYNVMWMAGLNGKIGKDWSWDASAQYTSDSYHADFKNLQDTLLWKRAIDVISNPAVGGVAGVGVGAPVCRVSTVAGGGIPCTPLNIFGPNALTPAQVRTVVGTGHQFWPQQAWDIVGNIQGIAFQDWAGDVSVAAGFEVRRLSVHGTNDPTSIAKRWFTGNNQVFTGANQDEEGYVEADVPLIKDMPFAKDVTFNGAFRYANYKLSGGAETWKLGVNWTVNDEVRVRMTNSRDLRAPTLNDLYALPGATTNPLNDPRVVPGTGKSYGTYSVLVGTGGNTALVPEVGITNTGGVVYSPDWLPGFTTSIDYYAIHLHNAITTLGSQAVINGCYVNNQTDLCKYITLSGNTTSPPNTIKSLAIQTLNNGTFETNGVDFEADYRFDAADMFWSTMPGSFNLRALGTFTDNYKTNALNSAGAPAVTQTVGTGSNAKWRGTFTVNYVADPVTASLTARYAGALRYSNTYNYTLGALNSVAPGQNDIGARTYFNGSVTYALPGSMSNWKLFLNVNNILNTSPPVDPLNLYIPQATSTGAALHDLTGRDVSIGFRVAF